MGVRGRTICVVVATALLVCAGAASASAATVTVGPVNPVRVPVNGHPANSDFTIFVEGDVALNADEVEGTVAAGGDLSFASSYNVAAGGAFPSTFLAPGDAFPTYLYVRGGIDFTTGPTNVLKVLNGGYAKIGDTSTYTALDRDQNNAVVNFNIVPPGAAYGSVPRIEGTRTQSPASIGAPVGTNLIDIDGAFAEYRTLTSQLAQCASTVVLTDDAGQPVASPITPGSRAHITLTPGVTNVLQISASDLAALGELTFDNRPNASTPLVVNVTGSSFTGSIPNLAGADSGTAPFMLWNFPTATAVTVTGGDSLEGTIYAPDAYVNWQVTQNIEGNVIAARFTHGVPAAPGGGTPREVHSFPFATTVTCTYDDGVAPPPPPPPPPPPTPTPTPTPTPAPTGPGGSGDPGDTATSELAASGTDGGGVLAGTAAAAVMLLGGAALAAGARRLRRRDGSR